jgi:type III secretion protein C
MGSLLAEFAGNFGLTLSLQVDGDSLVNGRFQAGSPSEFLTRLGSVYGFVWYTHSGVLHVSRASEMVSRAVALPAGLGQVRQVLTDLGVFESRFGWGELPQQGLVMVTGPASYVALIEGAIKLLPTVGARQQINVYKLRYASADDRVVQYRDQRMVHAGLAQVIRQLMVDTGAMAGGVTEINGRRVQLPSLGSLTPLPSSPEPVSATRGSGREPGREPVGAETPVGGASPAASAAPSAPGARSATPETGAGGPGAGSLTAGSVASGSGVRPSSSTEVAGDLRVRTPSIQVDSRLNALIIQDIPERMPLYERLIAQLDVPTPLLEIEAMIIDINSERIRELGVNWALSGESWSLRYGTPSASPATGTFGVAVAGSSSTLSAAAGLQLLAQVRALEIQGQARVQSRPSILTLENIGAVLDLSETFYVRVLGERFASVSPVTAGTSLRVTPRLIEQAETAIQMTIDIEDGQIQDRQIDTLPTVRRSSVNTQAIIRHGEALLIAGYSSDQNVDAAQKVPFLGDLPVVGALFSTRSKTLQKRERLFLIRPRVVAMGSTPVAGVPADDPRVPAWVLQESQRRTDLPSGRSPVPASLAPSAPAGPAAPAAAPVAPSVLRW